MTHVLVTGGAGYIGSHTCKALARAGFVPVCFDNLEAGHRDAVRWGPLRLGDVRDEAALVDVLRTFCVEAVIHFAGRISVAESVERPLDHYATNVAGTIALVRAMNRMGIRDLVYSSSAAVYGMPTDSNIAEQSPVLPISPYGRSKAMAEAIIADAVRAFALRAVALRYFNAAGADPDGEIGECHDPETHLIPLALRALDRGEPFTIHGDDYATPDGTCIRDYVHVCDLARAHVSALQVLRSGRSLPPSLNVGSGRGHSVREVIAAIERVTGRPLARRIGPRRPGDPPRLVADASAIRAELGWTPELEAIETIIETAWRWEKRRRRVDAPIA